MKGALTIVLLAAFITTAQAQIITLDSTVREPSEAVFSTKSASIMMTGIVNMNTTPENAALEASEQIKIDCDELVVKMGEVRYTFFISVTLAALNDYHWTVGLKPDGSVVYENIKPSEEANKYFHALARDLSCSEVHK